MGPTSKSTRKGERGIENGKAELTQEDLLCAGRRLMRSLGQVKHDYLRSEQAFYSGRTESFFFSTNNASFSYTLLELEKQLCVRSMDEWGVQFPGI